MLLEYAHFRVNYTVTSIHRFDRYAPYDVCRLALFLLSFCLPPPPPLSLSLCPLSSATPVPENHATGLQEPAIFAFVMSMTGMTFNNTGLTKITKQMMMMAMYSCRQNHTRAVAVLILRFSTCALTEMAWCSMW